MQPKKGARYLPNENDLSATDVECVAASMSVVRLLTNMTITLICVSALTAAWFFGKSQHYHKKYKDLKVQYDSRCEELNAALGEVGRVKLLNEDVMKENKTLDERIHEYKHLTTAGCRNLKVLERTLPMLPNIPQGVVVVAGVDTRRSDLFFPIKTILYDVNDPSDREFAIREAEELIETIQKA